MNRTSHLEEIVGVRYTGWAALDRDPQEDPVEFVCPSCGHKGTKPARRALAEYHFIDGFLQDIHGEAATCKTCRKSLQIAPFTTAMKSDALRRFSQRKQSES
jgi:predicted RNA-binding Zn-ribbon protein involved in translation (DUF1610 family)